METKNQSNTKSKLLDPKANVKALVRLIAIVIILLAGVWLFVRFAAGKKAADTVTSTILRQHIDLINTIEDLPASSWKPIGLTLPYAGTLSIDIVVKKGNDISVFLIQPDEVEKLKAKQKFSYIQGFDADKTKAYRRSERIGSGTFQLVLMDKSLGLLSKSSSDVQVTAKLDP